MRAALVARSHSLQSNPLRNPLKRLNRLPPRPRRDSNPKFV